ncbi:MAG: hypothetical protein Q8P92_00385, partial [Candidatus Daviesbacteria bacterium]|nr:hypothetical protein [Candidatus Daviesbacteria bacterium]
TISTISSTPAGNYTISVNGSPSAAAKNTCTLTIPPPGCTLPTVDIKANSSDGPVNIANNTSANLTWTTGNSPTSCTASGAWSGAKSVSGGSQSSGNLPGPNSYNFTITCSNTCGSNSDVVTINVPSPSTNCSFGSLSNPDGISPNPVPYNSSTSTYSNTQISWSTASYNSSNVYYYNPGSCTLSNCPSSGWTFITSAPADGTWDYVWNPNSFGPAQGSTHTIGITDSNNVLRCVKDVTFGSSTPPPASSSCTGISGPNTLLLQGGKATGTYAANFGGDSTNLVFHWSDNQGSTDDTVDNDVNWTFYNTGSYTLSATYSNATGSGSCGSKNIQVVQPSSICAEFDVTPDPTYVNTNAIIRPLVSNYSIISRIDVRYYKYPQPAAPPFTESNWQSIKTLQGTQHCVSGHVVESDGEPDEFICDVYDPNTFDWTENQKTTDWKTPNYEGYYYLGMEVYGADGTKIAGWNSGDTTDCTEVIRIRDDSTCIQNKPVYPDNLNASVINDDDVLLQWQIRNSNGSVNDSEQAYISTQAGFTPSSSNRVVSRLKAGSSLSVTDSSSTLSNLKNPVFYKVSAFNNASPGESPFSSTQGMAPLPFDTDTCSLSSSPTTATNFNISGSTFTWRKPSIAFATYSGWRVVNNNGLIFDVPASEVTESFYDSNNRQITWTMPTLIAGTYYIQAYAVLCDGKMYFGPISNTAVLSTSTSAASAPTTAPSGVTTTMGGGFKDQQPVITSWTDTNTNEAGFHLYRSTESLDPAKRTAATNYSLNNALFENLPAGTYYLAVKVTNNCGVGWSNYVKVDLTLTVKPWIQTTGGDVHSNVRINTPGGP